MGRKYPRLGIQEFGVHLLRTNDLDPIYVALVRCRDEYGWTRDQLYRWLVAYWCFYHAGVASWMSTQEGQQFWHWMGIAAENVDPSPTGGRWPRGAERRHCRGGQAVKCIRQLRHRYGPLPEQMVVRLTSGYDCGLSTTISKVSVSEVMERAQEHYLFGPWISFKIADMIDRVLGVPVDFDQGHMFMFKDPVEAALMLWRQHNGLSENARPKDQDHVLGLVVSNLSAMFMTFRAPPLDDRPVGLQEIETILCKWKSHMNGHYPLYNDIDEILAGLDPWTSESEAAAAFAVAMPQHKE